MHEYLQGPRRRGDVLRGRRAGPPPRRRARSSAADGVSRETVAGEPDRGVSRETPPRRAAPASYGRVAGLARRAVDAVLRALAQAADPTASTTVRDPGAGASTCTSPTRSSALDIAAGRGGAADRRPRRGRRLPGPRARRRAARGARVRLVESVGAQVRATSSARPRRRGLDEREVVRARAEEWSAGLGAHDLVTARALAALPVLVRVRGAAARRRAGVSWPGRAPSTPEEAGGRRRRPRRSGSSRASRAPSRPSRARATAPSTSSARSRPTPDRYPRRPGMATKRPLSAKTQRRAEQSRGTGRSGPNPPRPPLASGADGHRLRHREPEGRRREDDDRGQRRRVHRRGGLRDAARRRRPAGQRDGRPRRRARRGPGPLRRARRRGRRRTTRSAPTPIERALDPRLHARPRGREHGAAAAARAPRTGCATRSRRVRDATPTRCSTARRRSAR